MQVMSRDLEFLHGTLSDIEAGVATRLQTATEESDEYREFWCQQHSKRQQHARLPVLEQAKLEFGLPAANLTFEHVDDTDDTVCDDILRRVTVVEEAKSKLILAQIEYHNLLIKYKNILAELDSKCREQVDPQIIEYYKQLINGQTLKLRSMQLCSQRQFGLDKVDFVAVRAMLTQECMSMEEQLGKILSRRTEYERLARKYGELKRR